MTCAYRALPAKPVLHYDIPQSIIYTNLISLFHEWHCTSVLCETPAGI